MEEKAKKARFFDLPQSVQWAGWMLLGFGLYVCWDQYYWWTNREDYSFGFLVPFFVGYVLTERWPKLAAFYLNECAEGSAGSSRGWSRAWEVFFSMVFLLALLSMALGSLLRATQGPQTPASLSIAWGYCWLILSTVFLFSGENQRGEGISVRRRFQLVGLFLFPALIWLISAPLLTFLERNLSLFLLNRVSAVVFFLFDLFGTPIEQEGNVLFLGLLENGEPNRVMVEDACSGIRSLMACLFAGSFLAAVFMEKLWKKILLVALAMAFAFIMNIGRSLFLTLWAYNYGASSINGSVHDITGYAVLGLTCLGLILLLPILNFRHQFSEPFSGEEEDAALSSG